MAVATSRPTPVAFAYSRAMSSYVRIPNSEEPDDWAIIELQGEIQSRDEDDVSGEFIGDIHFTKVGVPILIIGHHILYGKETILPQPYAVLERRHAFDDSHVSQSLIDIPQGSQTLDNGDASVYFVKAFVTKKLLFKTRPKPIIANVPQN